MRSLSRFLPLVASAATAAAVVSLPLRPATGPSISSRRLFRQRIDSSLAVSSVSSVSSVSGPPHQPLVDQAEYYLADFAIGTPPQPMAVLVDTSGWVTWVNPDCGHALRPAACLALPRYNPAASRPSPRHVHTLDQIVQYGYSQGASLEGYEDVFVWGSTNATSPSGGYRNDTGGTGAVVRSQPFAVANYSIGLSTGVLGLAPDGRDGFDSAVSNSSVVATMAARQVIGSRVFSLSFGRGAAKREDVGGPPDRNRNNRNNRNKRNKIRAPHVGSLVFGGLDRRRFRGPLRRTPVVSPEEDGRLDGWRYWVGGVGVGRASGGGTGNQTAAVGFGSTTTYLLDSGTTGIYVERAVLDAVLSELNLTRGTRHPEGFPSVDCDFGRERPGNSSSTSSSPAAGALVFTFGTVVGPPGTAPATVRVPFASLVVPEPEPASGQCFLALSSGGDAYDDGDLWPILGANFFKSAYVVFDWDHREVAIAQGADCGGPDLVAVNGTVPDMEGRC